MLFLCMIHWFFNRIGSWSGQVSRHWWYDNPAQGSLKASSVCLKSNIKQVLSYLCEILFNLSGIFSGLRRWSDRTEPGWGREPDRGLRQDCVAPHHRPQDGQRNEATQAWPVHLWIDPGLPRLHFTFTRYFSLDIFYTIPRTYAKFTHRWCG